MGSECFFGRLELTEDPCQAEFDRARFLDLVLRNPINELVLRRLADLDLPDAYLVAGCLFQTVWNCLSDKQPDADILDYDVFYFDSSDLSWAAEDTVIRRCNAVFAGAGADIQVRNQARVHLWYPDKFGVACPPLESSRDGIDHFLNESSCFGVRMHAGSFDVYAPFGYDDVFAMIVRPNRQRELPRVYHRKASRWATAWPGLTVVPWFDTTE